MNDNDALIDELSKDVATKPMRPFHHIMGRAIVIVVAYLVIVMMFIGVRDDITTQLTNELYVLEILALLMLIIFCLRSALLLALPDAGQKKPMLGVAIASGILATVLAFEASMPADSDALLTHGFDTNSMKCTLCIAAISALPAAWLFGWVQRGATTHPLKAGLSAVLAASSMGCLVVRLAEVNDSMVHLFEWHYIPTIIFALLGAGLGALLLRW